MDSTRHNKKNILSLFTQSVSHATMHGKGLNSALKILAKKRSIPFLSVHFLNYDKDGNYGFSCIGRWIESIYSAQPCKYYAAGLQNKDLPDNLFEMDSAYIRHSITLSKKNIQTSINLIIIPLFLSDSPFGIFSLLDTGQLDEYSIDFFITAASIIELWADRENEKKLCQDMISRLPHPVLAYDKNEIVTIWNRACERMTRWRACDVINKPKYTSGLTFYGIKRPMAPNLILTPNPSWETEYYEFKRLEDGDVINAISFCNAIADGGAFLSTKTIRLYDINQKICGAIHAVRDLYLEREVVENLHQTESMYKAISDFAGVGIILLNENEIIYCNKQMEDFIGTSLKNLTIKKFIKWINPEGNRFIQNSLKLLIKGHNNGMSFEFKIKDPNGDLRFFRSLAGKIEHEERPVVHIIIDDTTETRRVAEQTRLNEMRMLHQSRLSSLGVMASSIAHELNQPLNIIKVIADGFLYGKEQGWNIDQREFYDDMEMISRQVARMDNAVIRNIQSCYSKEERNIDSVYINVNEAIENVFSMMEQQLKVHGIIVKKDLHHSLLKCKGSKWRMEQVVMNLLINARQALDETNHIEKYIIIKTSMALNNIEIEISDNATGIPPDIKDKIFDPFFTTKKSGYGSYGTGLGLAICQSIIFECGGNMDFFNNDQGGVTFIITLPGLKGNVT